MKIGRYEIRKELGRGGMGVVYLAWDPAISREVALKRLELEGFSEAQTKEIRERFKREAMAAGRLNDPNIVTVYDVGEHEGETFIAMEYIQGRSLEDLLEEDALLPLPKVLEIISSIASALDHAHSQGIVHRDIKPANILLPGEGGARVTDFGIARIENMRMTREGAMLGSPSYMSPEQVLGKELDGRADIFSLGVILYIMITGEKPFPGDSMATLSYRIVQEEPTPPSQLNPALDKRLDALITKALAKSPAQRYPTSGQMAADLAEIAGQPSASDPNDTFIIEERTLVTGDGAAVSPSVSQSLPSITAIPVPGDTRVVSESVSSTPLLKKAAYAASVAMAVIAIAWMAIWLNERGVLSDLQEVLLSTPVAKANGDNEQYRPMGIVPKPYILWRDANKAFQAEEYEQARTLLGELSMLTHADEEVYLMLGKVNRKLRKDGEAIENYRKALQINPEVKTDVELINDLIDSMGKSRTSREAMAILAELVGAPAEDSLIQAAADKNDRVSHNALRVLIEIWSKRVENHPKDADTWLAMAHANVQLGVNADAIEFYRRALIARPQERDNPAVALNLVGMLDGRKGNEAMAVLVEQVGPPAVDAIQGVLPNAAGRLRKNAIETLRRIWKRQIENEASNSQAALDLAFLEIGEKKYDAAWKAFATALERNPGFGTRQKVLDVLIEALARSEDQAVIDILATVGESALPALKQALNSDKSDLRWRAAGVLEIMGKQGEFDRMQLLKKDLLDENSSCPVRKRAAKKLAQTGNLKAKKLLQKALENPNAKKCGTKSYKKALESLKIF